MATNIPSAFEIFQEATKGIDLTISNDAQSKFYEEANKHIENAIEQSKSSNVYNTENLSSKIYKSYQAVLNSIQNPYNAMESIPEDAAREIKKTEIANREAEQKVRELEEKIPLNLKVLADILKLKNNIALELNPKIIAAEAELYINSLPQRYIRGLLAAFVPTAKKVLEAVKKTEEKLLSGIQQAKAKVFETMGKAPLWLAKQAILALFQCPLDKLKFNVNYSASLNVNIGDISIDCKKLENGLNALLLNKHMEKELKFIGITGGKPSLAQKRAPLDKPNETGVIKIPETNLVKTPSSTVVTKLNKYLENHLGGIRIYHPSYGYKDLLNFDFVPFQFSPTNVDMQKNASYNTKNLLGRITPIQTYLYNEAKSVSLELKYFATDRGNDALEKNIRKNIQELEHDAHGANSALKWYKLWTFERIHKIRLALQGLNLPTFTEKMGFQYPPPVVEIHFGNIFKREVDSLIELKDSAGRIKYNTEKSKASQYKTWIVTNVQVQRNLEDSPISINPMSLYAVEDVISFSVTIEMTEVMPNLKFIEPDFLDHWRHYENSGKREVTNMHSYQNPPKGLF